jgi:glucose/arabinose dehydrogenase
MMTTDPHAGRRPFTFAAATRLPRAMQLAAAGLLAMAVTAAADAACPVLRDNPTDMLPQGFSTQRTIEGLQWPTAAAFSRDGRVFIAEQSGRIKVFDNLRDTTPTLFADLRVAVHAYADRGLLGLALHPDFPDQPYVYVAYTYDGGADSDDAPRWGALDPDANPDDCATRNTGGCPASGRLSRLRAEGDVAVEETVLIRDWYMQYPNHAIDAIKFGADGYLYVSAGEGASSANVDVGKAIHPTYPDHDSPAQEGGALRSQDLETIGDPTGLSGTIIRVDPLTGEAAADNPLAGDADPMAQRIVAYGLRNPFRFAFRPGTSEAWIADVGWETAEEINVLPEPAGRAAPVNFGWPCYEGAAPQAGYANAALPICQALYDGSSRFAYLPPWREFVRPEHADPGEQITAASLSALAFYAGEQYPPAYRGALFVADLVTARLYVACDADGDGRPDGPDSLELFARELHGVVDLLPGPGGDLYFLSIYNGRLERLRYGANASPFAALTTAAGSDWQGPPRVVGFEAGASYDPDNAAADALRFGWDLDGDGTFDDVEDPHASFAEREFAVGGSHTVSVRVTDRHGASDTASLRVTVGDSVASARIAAPTSTERWHTDQLVTLRAEGAEADGTPLPDRAYVWRVSLLHCVTGPDDCHQHPHLSDAVGRERTFTAPEHEYPSYLQITLDATTSEGVLTRQLRFDPLLATVTLASEPPGLALLFGSAAQTTPFQRNVIVGSAFTVGAASEQIVDGRTWEFDGWSDGGARQHDLVADAAGSLVLTALYRESTRVFDDGFEPAAD